MPHFYIPSSEEIGMDEFVQRYGRSYYLGENRIVTGASQSSRFVEGEIDRLLVEGIQEQIDVVHILAWKFGKIKHAESEKAQAFCYANDWTDAESLKVKRYGKEFDLQRITSYVVENIETLERMAETNPQEVLENLRGVGVKGLGTVYLVTLLYFISKGEYPIFDRFAAKALYAIENDVEPGGEVGFKELPDKNSVAFHSVMNERILPFKKQLERVFGEGCCKERDIDRALWVYGHLFPDSKD